MKHMNYFCLLIFAILTACSPNTDKTLVSWVKLNDLRIEGGSVLTIQSGEQFDGIVFGETESGKWIAGSENWKRSNSELDNVKAETDEAKIVGDATTKIELKSLEDTEPEEVVESNVN